MESINKSQTIPKILLVNLMIVSYSWDPSIETHPMHCGKIYQYRHSPSSDFLLKSGIHHQALFYLSSFLFSMWSFFSFSILFLINLSWIQRKGFPTLRVLVEVTSWEESLNSGNWGVVVLCESGWRICHLCEWRQREEITHTPSPQASGSGASGGWRSYLV